MDDAVHLAVDELGDVGKVKQVEQAQLIGG